MPSDSRAPNLRFGPYEVDIRAGELRKQGSKIRLQEKPLRVLASLAAQPGTLVTREELKKRLWPDATFVDFETGLNTAVSKLREALNDDAEYPRYIETIPRRGYRFVFPVEPNGHGNGNSAADAATVVTAAALAAALPLIESAATGTNEKSSPGIVPSPRGSRWLITVLIVVACATIGGAYFAWTHRTRPAPQFTRAMLVVLPFENLTGNPDDDYICDGFTEEMITQLGALNHDQLGVIARTSAMTYKDGAKPIKQIAQELGVNYALEGSVRKMGDALRVTAQLIRADDQTHLWAHTYDRSRDDLEKLEGELAQDIAHQVQIQLTPQAQLALSNSHAVVPEAYRSYLKGRYNLNMRSPAGMKQATEAFEEAIHEDPTYAPAYSGLADTYNLLIYYGFLSGRDGIPKARAAAQQAVDLDDALSEGHASLGYVNLMWDLNWAEADKQFQRAIELDGSYSTAHHWYALLLAARGERQASLAQIRESQRLDPRSLIVATAAAYVSYFARDDVAAAALCHDVLQRDPNFMVAHTVRGLALEQQGNPQEAIAEFQKALQLSHARPAPYLDYLGHAYAAAGQRDQAETLLVELDQAIKPGGISPMYKAATLTALGRTDQAMDAIEEGFQGGGAEKIWLKADPRYQPLHGGPRYERLVRLAGMTQ